MWIVHGMWVVHVVQVLCPLAADVLWMSVVVRGIRGVGRICEMSMCLAQAGVSGEG